MPAQGRTCSPKGHALRTPDAMCQDSCMNFSWWKSLRRFSLLSMWKAISWPEKQHLSGLEIEVEEKRTAGFKWLLNGQGKFSRNWKKRWGKYRSMPCQFTEHWCVLTLMWLLSARLSLLLTQPKLRVGSALFWHWSKKWCYYFSSGWQMHWNYWDSHLAGNLIYRH